MTNKARRFAVVIVAHRQYATLELCLRGFQAVVVEPFDLIFVDNGSGGALINWIANTAPKVTSISLKENLLFCGGYNAGIRLAIERNYEYVMIVNADTEVVNPGFVTSLIEAMERIPRTAFIGPLVYYRKTDHVQTTCQSFPSLVRSMLVWLPFHLLPGLISRQPSKEHEVEFLNGVCVLCRVAALREIGLMDESFGAYVEDADWAWRARALNWQSVFAPVPSIIHHEESRGYEHHSFKSFLLKRNTVHWLLKIGRFRSAWCYAKASLFLAHLRTLLASDLLEREAYRLFAFKLRLAYRQLLTGKAATSNCTAHSTSAEHLSLHHSRTNETD